MATKKKLLQAAAGSAGGAGLDITEVFSTYLYEGNGTTQTITNGIDLDGEGGMVWTKSRSTSANHHIVDTERGVGDTLFPNTTGAEFNMDSVTGFLGSGFTLGNNASSNSNGNDFVSWSFLKSENFFTCLTYTGNGVDNRTIAHNLGADIGTCIIKRTDSSGNWMVWHRSLPDGENLRLQSTDAQGGYNAFYEAAMTDTTFGVRTYTANTNISGATYVAYLFAHNDSGDGEFGPDSDQDIIKCGSYAHAYAGTEVNLGFEPQWILFKAADQANNWYIFDAMRGIVTGGLSGDGDAALFPNTSGAENVNTWGVDLTATGFIVYGNNIASSGNIIYTAIRRGPLTPPEAGTEVFSPNLASGYPRYPSGFATDFVIQSTRSSGSSASYSRLQGNNNLDPGTTAQESASAWDWAQMDGSGTNFTSTNYIGWNWKRAPSYFDALCYSGNSTAGRTVSHNLGVAPEMIWTKKRSTTGNWGVYHSGTGATKFLQLNQKTEARTLTSPWNDTAPTSSVFTLGTSALGNGSGVDYIAYLFASLAGVSKLGSYVGLGAGNPLTIDCGFTSGARFVLIKKTDVATGSVPDGSWFVFDSVRGITTSTNPYLQLNTTGAEASNFSISPHSSGFTVIQDGPTELNQTGKNYIFYAIA